MTPYVALLRAVNVGGTGKLSMTDLKRLCESAGFAQVQTYIASGNVVFLADGRVVEIKAALEQTLQAHAGQPIKAFVRKADDMAAIVSQNPFPEAEANKVLVFFLDAAPTAHDLKATGQTDETIVAGQNEVYVHFPDGQGKSRLKLGAAESGTGRNMNTVTKLSQMAAAV